MSISISGSQITFNDASVQNTAATGFGFKNRIINGAMNIWQRGTTYALTTAITYGSADRWNFWQGGVTASGIANQVASGLTGFQYAVKMGRNNGSALTGAISAIQAAETNNSIDLAGQSITLSFWAKAGANFSATSSQIASQVYSGTGTDQSAASMGSWTNATVVINGTPSITTSWVKYSFTGTCASNVSQVGVYITWTPTGTAGADDNLYITGVQLEKGSTATSFDYRPYGTELALCQRYFFKTFAQGTAPASNLGATSGCLLSYTNTSASTATIDTMLQFPVTMRTAPGAGGTTFYNPQAANSNWRNSSNGADIASSLSDSSDRTLQIRATSLTAGQWAYIHVTASAEL